MLTVTFSKSVDDGGFPVNDEDDDEDHDEDEHSVNEDDNELSVDVDEDNHDKSAFIITTSSAAISKIKRLISLFSSI